MSNAANPSVHLPGGSSSEMSVRFANPSRPLKLVPFPAIMDWSSLRIGLIRSECFGSCPAYSVEIRGDGTVIYDGHACVTVKGRRVAQISPQAVRDLVQQFREADYFRSFDRYAASVTDLPTYVTSIVFDGHTKSVSDYGGSMAGMPPSMREVELTIDAAAGTAKWIGKSQRPNLSCLFNP